MPKTILLIENDAPYAAEVSGALEAVGYQVRVTGDGKDGLELARDLGPDAIVLCVELPRLSGYSICNKLKKDETLRSIPLVLTSSEATEEVFEDHRKLKVRAEAYLIKPYLPAALLELLATLVGVPDGGGAETTPGPEVLAEAAAEEVVSLQDDLTLETLAREPGEEMPALDLDSLPDEPVAAVATDGNLEEDLKLLDDAFDGLSAPAPGLSRGATAPDAGTEASDARSADEAIEKALGVDRPVTSEDLEAASASLPEGDEASARAELGGLEDEADVALGVLDGRAAASAAPPTSAFDAIDALGGVDEPAGFPAGPSRPSAKAVVATGVAAGGRALDGLIEEAGGPATGAADADLARLESEAAGRRTALQDQEDGLGALQERLQRAEAVLLGKEAEAAALKVRGDASASQARKAEAEARAAREELRQVVDQAREAEDRAMVAEARLGAAEQRGRAAEQELGAQRRVAEQLAASLTSKAAELATALAGAARLAVADRELERMGAELVAARGAVEEARAETGRRTADLKRRVAELEAANTKNEERVVKAYLKIKGDEKVRDKARKALSIALQLLEEGLPPEPADETRPRPVPE